MNKKYLTIKETIKRYNCSNSWFYARRRKGLEPLFLDIDGKILYPAEETDQWFEEHLVKNNQGEGSE